MRMSFQRTMNFWTLQTERIRNSVMRYEDGFVPLSCEFAPGLGPIDLLILILDKNAHTLH